MTRLRFSQSSRSFRATVLSFALTAVMLAATGCGSAVVTDAPPSPEEERELAEQRVMIERELSKAAPLRRAG